MLTIKLAIAVTILMLLMVGCLPSSSLVLTTPNLPVAVQQNGITISALPPQGWRAFIDNTHLILTTQPDTDPAIAINIWMPREDLIRDIPALSGTSTAEVLREITNKPSLIGNAIASTPQPFRWMQYDGAYYLLNNGTQSATLVIALRPTQSTQMIVINITADTSTLSDLGRFAGTALENVLINQQPLRADLFNLLPQPLELPTAEGIMGQP